MTPSVARAVFTYEGESREGSQERGARSAPRARGGRRRHGRASRRRLPPATPIVIGWADDSTGNMAPFDQPALAAAKVEVAKINAKGGVTGRPLKIVTCDTQGNKPDVAKSCGAKLVDQKVDIIFTTCDVDYATPVVQESINAGLLTIAPCIGTDQMGPSALRRQGQARLQLRQRGAGRGLGDGAVRVEQGLEDGRHRHQHAARVLQGGRAGLPDPLQAARRQDRLAGHRTPRARTTWERRQPAERREGRRVRDVDVVRRAARLRHRASARSATRRRSSTRGPATARTGCPRPASRTTTP